MTFLKILIFALALVLPWNRGMTNKLRQGFSLPDCLEEFTLTYRSVDNLILLPFTINDTIRFNLVLDTGCRTLILFGKQFEKKLTMVRGKTIQFSGMGSGKPARGEVSLGNAVSMGPVEGKEIPIVVVPGRNLFRNHMRIDGLIGYDIFTRFEIELHANRQQITFRSAFRRSLPAGYSHIPLTMTGDKPMIASTLALPGEVLAVNVLIDTGSVLGLLLKSSDASRFDHSQNTIVGKGLNGIITGISTRAHSLVLQSYEMNNVPAGIIYSKWHDYASIGMAVLKDYAVIINYVQLYVGLRSNLPEMEKELL